ncbi:D-Ala-D-Ala carboxypeptidase family metallohydrolase [Aurantimonas sp. A2-1-M11]|uniref:YcbK family protein n=1 Tax=Aurantimonas sp. A2-1-M11 TaxID=3113712 RepID=UPI002F94EE8F
MKPHVLLAVLLSTAPILSGCVSAIDDTSAFGFAGAASASDAAADVAATSLDEGSAAAADGAETADTPAVEIASAAPAATAVAGEAAAPPPPIAEMPATTPLIPAGTDSKAVAAYATDTSSPGGGSRSSETSLFSSLFARSEARTPIANVDKGKSRRVVLQREGAAAAGDALPGVDPSSLFEIGQRASADEDMIEDMESSYRVASLSTGLARLAPNGLMVQRESVETSCFPADLVRILRSVEQRYRTKVIVTSGYRSPTHNKRVKGARRSQHMGCKAADIIIPGADNMAVAAYVRSLPGRGGVGTYCHTQAIHVDVGHRRDWNWSCRGRK